MKSISEKACYTKIDEFGPLLKIAGTNLQSLENLKNDLIENMHLTTPKNNINESIRMY